MFFSLCHDFGRTVLLLNYSIQEKSGNCKCLLAIMTYVVCKKVPCCRGDDLQSAYQTVFGLCLMFYYKETAYGFGWLYWFLQCGIPRHTCRFYWLLAGAVGKRQGISIPYPSPTPLLTPLGIRCGGAYLLPRAYTNLGSYIPVLSLLPCSEYGLAVGVRFCIVRVSVGLPSLYRSFFIIGGIGCSCLRLCGVLLWSIVGFALTAIGSIFLIGNGMG